MLAVFNLLAFILTLSVLVLVHELGHFVTAKLFGVKTYEFGIGYPPRAKVLFRKWRTDFSINWLPFGGFVRLAGEDRDVGKLSKSPEMFYNKRKWQRIAILLAGVTMNFLFGILLFSIIYTVSGIPEQRKLGYGVMITGLAPGAPAEEAGLMFEDVVVGLRAEEELLAINGADEFVELVGERKGSEVKLMVEREGQTNEIELYVRGEGEVPEGEGALGVAISDYKIESVFYPVWQMPLRGAKVGVESAVGFGVMILMVLWGMVADLFVSGQVPADVAGPFYIGFEFVRSNLVGEGWPQILNTAAILSVNLAIVNLLPIPALDGGRIVFVLLEKALGGKFKPKYEYYANMVGFSMILFLIVAISVKDVGSILGELGK